jgi:hypothetical protein
MVAESMATCKSSSVLETKIVFPKARLCQYHSENVMAVATLCIWGVGNCCSPLQSRAEKPCVTNLSPCSLLIGSCHVT